MGQQSSLLISIENQDGFFFMCKFSSYDDQCVELKAVLDVSKQENMELTIG